MSILRFVAASFFVMFALAGCGGGGGGSAAAPTSSNPPSSSNQTIVTGIASKGPFSKGSTVNIYAVTNGVKGALITSTQTTDDNGSYNANLGSYSGPILVEVSGAYLDEATGHTVPVSATDPIRAALPQAQGTVTLPVTPLTELAVQKMGGALTTSTITAANTLVSSIFKVDIVGTLPVAPTSTAVGVATQAQKDYTLALAAVSQIASTATGASDTDKLKSALTALSQGISSSGMTSSAAATFETALNNFVTSNANNHTGISDTSTTSLVNVGTLSKSYTLSLQGNIPPGSIKGLQMVVTLPTGATVNINTSSTNNNSTVLASSLVMSGNAPSDAILIAKYAAGALNIGIVTTNGISAGQFATLTCNIPTGTSAPPASAFAVNDLKVVDGDGKSMAGVTVTAE